jgi:hypothetical protein
MTNGFHTPPHKSYLRAITLRGLETLWKAIQLSRARTAHNQTTERKTIITQISWLVELNGRSVFSNGKQHRCGLVWIMKVEPASYLTALYMAMLAIRWEGLPGQCDYRLLCLIRS